jgi:hypothetical protein
VNSSRSRSTQTREQIETRSAEEYKRLACENLTCDLKTLSVLQYSDIGSV